MVTFRGDRKRGTMTLAGRKEMVEIEENGDAHDQEVGIAIIITIIIAATTEREDGIDLVPVLGLGPRVRGVGAGTAELVWRNPPSQ